MQFLQIIYGWTYQREKTCDEALFLSLNPLAKNKKHRTSDHRLTVKLRKEGQKYSWGVIVELGKSQLGMRKPKRFVPSF